MVHEMSFEPRPVRVRKPFICKQGAHGRDLGIVNTIGGAGGQIVLGGAQGWLDFHRLAEMLDGFVQLPQRQVYDAKPFMGLG